MIYAPMRKQSTAQRRVYNCTDITGNQRGCGSSATIIRRRVQRAVNKLEIIPECGVLRGVRCVVRCVRSACRPVVVVVVTGATSRLYIIHVFVHTLYAEAVTAKCAICRCLAGQS